MAHVAGYLSLSFRRSLVHIQHRLEIAMLIFKIASSRTNQSNFRLKCVERSFGTLDLQARRSFMQMRRTPTWPGRFFDHLVARSFFQTNYDR